MYPLSVFQDFMWIEQNMEICEDLRYADIVDMRLFSEDDDYEKCEPHPKITLKEAIFHKNNAYIYWIEAGNDNRDILSCYTFQKCDLILKKSKYPLTVLDRYFK